MGHGKQKVKHMNKFFVKSFWISLLLLIVIGLLAALTFNFQAGLAERIYGMDSDDYAKILCNVMGIWKVLIIQFTLVPAIASYFIAKHIEEDHDGGSGCGASGCDC